MKNNALKQLSFLLLMLFLLHLAFLKLKKRPVIGISSTTGEGTNTSAPLTYVQSVIRAGGVPVILPLTDDPELLSRMLDVVDGVIMTGGEDIDPLKYFGEEPIPGLGEISFA